MKRSSAGSPMSSGGYSSLLAVLLLLLAAQPATADDPPADAAGDTGPEAAADGGDPEVREVGGTSIIGNRELPKSLYIVPWKNSEVGVQTDLSRDLLDEGLTPVDPLEFERQVQYHEYHQRQQ